MTQGLRRPPARRPGSGRDRGAGGSTALGTRPPGRAAARHERDLRRRSGRPSGVPPIGPRRGGARTARDAPLDRCSGHASRPRGCGDGGRPRRHLLGTARRDRRRRRLARGGRHRAPRPRCRTRRAARSSIRWPSPRDLPWWDFPSLLADTVDLLDPPARAGIDAALDRWAGWVRVGRGSRRPPTSSSATAMSIPATS